jgi:hypothetical protein
VEQVVLAHCEVAFEWSVSLLLSATLHAMVADLC